AAATHIFMKSGKASFIGCWAKPVTMRRGGGVARAGRCAGVGFRGGGGTERFAPRGVPEAWQVRPSHARGKAAGSVIMWDERVGLQWRDRGAGVEGRR